MAFKLGQLVIELAANTARLQTDMGKAVGIAERGAAGIKKAFSFVTAGVGGGVIGAALLGAAKQAISLGDDLQKAAQKAGIGGKAISELAYAAKLADVDLASLSNAIKKMQIALSQAASGGKEQISTLKALGLSIDQITGLKADKQFELIAQQIASLTDPADRARAATELFGKAGADLLPLFAEGAEGIKKAREEAEKLGYSFSDETLKRLSDADNAIKRLSSSWDSFATVLTAKVAPALTKVLDDASSGRLYDRAKKFAASPIYGIYSAAREVFGGDEKKPGGVGRPGGDIHNTSPTGYAAQNAAEEAAKAAAASEKEMTKFIDGYHASLLEMNADVDRESDAALKRDGERWMQRQDDAAAFYEDYKQREKDLQVYREEQWKQSTAVFKDYFVSAFEDMINTGKFQWRGFLSFLVAEFAKKQFGKLFDQIFSSSSSNGNGIFGSIIGAIAGAFGSKAGGASGSGWSGPRASGGDVSAGHTYTVGERGTELFRPGVSGSIVPNHALGGVVVNINNNVDARGATVDLIKALPGILKQNNDQLEGKMVSRLRRDFYGLAT